MNKDVIYIDVEDDITAIIGKLKASKDKVVALVPPKHVGVLQSAVNLRLLARAAKQSDKSLALVTNNQALTGLAASAGIPVAKNLQTPPELADIPALKVDDEDDIIDGSSLPVGEHAGQGVASDDTEDKMVAELAKAPAPDETPKKPKTKTGPKVPNFNKFRKRLIFGIGGGILLILFIIWATIIAPRATVVISAKTSSSSINQPIAISTSAQTNLEASTVKGIVQQQSEDKTVQFNATGSKDAGSKATGEVTFSSDSISVIGSGVTIPAGTKLTSSSGKQFATDSAVTLTLMSNHGTTGVTAIENGSSYNAASGSMAGAPSGINASLNDPTSGGVTKTVKVVSAEDVQNAKNQIASENMDDIRNNLKSKFGNNALVIDQSFAVDYADASSKPDVGEEASNATLSVKVTYKLYAIDRSEISKLLDQSLKKQLDGKSDQKVYSNGSDKAQLQDVTKSTDGAKATLIATAQIGPKIDDNQVKEQVRGKRFGEIQQSIESIRGVNDVDVKFFPFWVTSVPDDTSRITVEFKLDESK